MQFVILFLVAIVLFILIKAYFNPRQFTVSRSLEMKATPAKIFALIIDFKEWAKWSPYDKVDPTMQKTYSEPSKGKGATYAWLGNKNIGEGNMVITDATPPSEVKLDLNFIKPMKANNVAVFSIEKGKDTTRVTWSMSGEVNYFFRIMHMLMNIDKMVGRDFEKGLLAIQELTEKK